MQKKLAEPSPAKDFPAISIWLGCCVFPQVWKKKVEQIPMSPFTNLDWQQFNSVIIFLRFFLSFFLSLFHLVESLRLILFFFLSFFHSVQRPKMIEFSISVNHNFLPNSEREGFSRHPIKLSLLWSAFLSVQSCFEPWTLFEINPLYYVLI